MKTSKILATVLALVCILSLCAIPTFASTLTALGSEEQNVTGSFNAGEGTETVYSVKIEWGAMNFTYSNAGKWDANTHTYEDKGSWTVTGGDTVTVTNHSNVDVKVTFTFTKDTTTDKSTYEGKMSVKENTLAAGKENKPDDADCDKVTSQLTFTGALNHTVTTATKLGTVTVTIAGVDSEP